MLCGSDVNGLAEASSGKGSLDLVESGESNRETVSASSIKGQPERSAPTISPLRDRLSPCQRSQRIADEIRSQTTGVGSINWRPGRDARLNRCSQALADGLRAALSSNPGVGRRAREGGEALPLIVLRFTASFSVATSASTSGCFNIPWKRASASLGCGRTTTLAGAPRSAKRRPLSSADARAASNCALILSTPGNRPAGYERLPSFLTQEIKAILNVSAPFYSEWVPFAAELRARTCRKHA
jgi:hypothetical protein